MGKIYFVQVDIENDFGVFQGEIASMDGEYHETGTCADVAFYDPEEAKECLKEYIANKEHFQVPGTYEFKIVDLDDDRVVEYKRVEVDSFLSIDVYDKRYDYVVVEPKLPDINEFQKFAIIGFLKRNPNIMFTNCGQPRFYKWEEEQIFLKSLKAQLCVSWSIVFKVIESVKKSLDE